MKPSPPRTPNALRWRSLRPDHQNPKDSSQPRPTSTGENKLRETIYHGWPRPDGQISVVIEYSKGNYRLLPHIVRHSPTGFNCGYDGNGPRDLALSLLTDATNGCATCSACDAAPPILGNSALPPRHSGTSGPTAVVNQRPSSCLYDCNAKLRQLPYLHYTEQIIAQLPQRQAWKLRRSDTLRWLSRLPHQTN